MRFEPLAIDGAALVRIEPHPDPRGFFARTFCVEEFARRPIMITAKHLPGWLPIALARAMPCRCRSATATTCGTVKLTVAATVIDRKSTRLNSSHLGISYAV